MINAIRRLFCKHDFEIVEDYDWIAHPKGSYLHKELRKFLVCKKCGHIKKISKY